MKKLVTRADFQAMAGARLREAGALLAAGEWSGAYYLAGYALELGLKSLVIKKLMATDAFPDQKLIQNSYTHSLKVLVGTAGLTADLDAAVPASPALSGGWRAAQEWSEQSRYYEWDEIEAREMMDAVKEVMAWIRTQW